MCVCAHIHTYRISRSCRCLTTLIHTYIVQARNRDHIHTYIHSAGKKSRSHTYIHTYCRKEIEILSMLDHPHVLKLHGAVVDDDNICIVTELVPGGMHACVYVRM